MAVLWAGMMVVWLGGLAFGVWWMWPQVERGVLSGEVVAALVWLVIGTAAWILALNLGIRRYFRR